MAGAKYKLLKEIRAEKKGEIGQRNDPSTGSG
jgi:hypothetical protein